MRSAALALLVGMAAPSSGASSLEGAVLARINAVRADPAGFALVLERFAASFKGRVGYMPGDPVGRQTKEGRRAVEEAIAFLRMQSPLPPLAPAALLARSAQRFAVVQGAAGGFGHLGADQSTPGSRATDAGGDSYVAEIIAYGPPTAEDVVRQFVVDDGVPGRGHRMAMFAPGWRFAGVGCARHKIFGGECVVDLGETEDGQPGPLPEGP